MVKIRLMRMGSKKAPTYRVVIMDVTAPQKSRYIEHVGHYSPQKNPQGVELKEDRIVHWLSVGAQPTDTVRSLLRKEGILRRIHEAKTGTAVAVADEAESDAADAAEAKEVA